MKITTETARKHIEDLGRVSEVPDEMHPFIEEMIEATPEKAHLASPDYLCGEMVDAMRYAMDDVLPEKEDWGHETIKRYKARRYLRYVCGDKDRF